MISSSNNSKNERDLFESWQRWPMVLMGWFLSKMGGSICVEWRKILAGVLTFRFFQVLLPLLR